MGRFPTERGRDGDGSAEHSRAYCELVMQVSKAEVDTVLHNQSVELQNHHLKRSPKQRELFHVPASLLCVSAQIKS